MNTLALILAFAAILALAGDHTVMAQGLALAGVVVTAVGFMWRPDRRPPFWKYEGLRRRGGR